MLRAVDPAIADGLQHSFTGFPFHLRYGRHLRRRAV